MSDTVIRRRHGLVLEMRLNRPEKRNAATVEMLRELSLAFGELDRDSELRVGLVIWSHHVVSFRSRNLHPVGA